MIASKEDLAKIVGAENLLDDERTIESYSKDESFVHPMKPRFVIRPKNADAVQQLVQWANETQTPLVPVSSGPPHYRGDTVPGAPGAVTVDLSGMKKIVRIDTRNRMVLIEPGVTYPELQPELAKAGLRASSPLLPRPNKSVVASLLEREPTLIPRLQWNMLEPLRATEVVWGDGQKMRTGDAGSSLEDDWKRGFAQIVGSGPAQTDFYKVTSAAQGSMGIVTWASVKCEILPAVEKLYFVPAQKLEDLIDLTYGILRIRFGDQLFLMNNWDLAMVLGKDAGQIRALSEKLPRWMTLVGIAGRERLPEERVAYQEKDLSEMAQRYGLQLLPARAEIAGDEVLESILKPSRESYWKSTYKRNCLDIFFLSTLENAPKFVKAMYAVADGFSYPTSEIGVYLQPVHQGASCHIEFNLPYDRSNAAELARMKELYTKGSEEMLRQGAYYSRPYGIWANMAFNRDAQTTEVLRKIKDIFDPNGIMNPGKLCF